MAEITSNKAPNKHTEGAIGDIYNVNGVEYTCVRIIKTTIDEIGNQEFIYEWEREYVGGGDSSIDMTDYQTIEDNGLIANDKTIVGAINELNDMVNETAVGTRVLEYVTNKPGSYPTFDATFSANCTTEIINNNDGTYTHIVYQTNPDTLPTSISFRDNTNLLSLSYVNTTNVTNMSTMFYGCNSITDLDVSSFDTTNVKNMSAMFRNCSALTSLDVSSFDTSNVTNMSYMFSGCISITDLEQPQNLKITHSISSMTLLPAQEIIQWLNALPTVTDSPTITIGTSLSFKLTAEEIAIATNKGWVVS